MDEKLKPVLEENRNLKTKLEKLENKVQLLEKDKKSNNIVIYGLKEGKKSVTELLETTRQKLHEELNIKVENSEINKIYRIGNLGNKEKPRPTLVSFINGWKKSEVLKTKKKSKELYISEDYTKETLEKRKALLPQLKEERDKGNIAYLKDDKLFIKENVGVKDRRKREPSASPYDNLQPKKQQLTSSTEKINAFDLMRGRSNSFTSQPSEKQQ
ncbi:uncharacterized protein LOC103579024 [Microplitis demolitor]|uniref:uncharacterized protein LOC103579024 n=1 Tax=Microplitis demolitor TaxID=69319 RepID=UPI00235B7017|nr:uncharacterized protein LOC103579024 [Microplitis demolitor]